MSHNKQTEGEIVTLDWYDGPLCQISRLDFGDGEPLVQVRSLGWSEGSYPREVHVIRLDREKVQAMLDMLDGKPITDWHGDVVAPKAAAERGKEQG